jgi:hypothetical protein
VQHQRHYVFCLKGLVSPQRLVQHPGCTPGNPVRCHRAGGAGLSSVLAGTHKPCGRVLAKALEAYDAASPLPEVSDRAPSSCSISNSGGTSLTV